MSTLPKRITAADGWTLDRQRLFIEELSRSGSVECAARAVGVHPSSAYRFRHRPAGKLFSAAWDAARQRAFNALTESALARAIHGEERPLYSRGEVIGTQRVHNDRLVIFLLQSMAKLTPPDQRDSELKDQDPTFEWTLGHYLNAYAGPHRPADPAASPPAIALHAAPQPNP